MVTMMLMARQIAHFAESSVLRTSRCRETWSLSMKVNIASGFGRGEGGSATSGGLPTWRPLENAW